MATAPPSAHAAPWPLARRLASGLAEPGGPAMARRALEGAGLSAGDRVVELAPGAGLTAALVLESEPREWTGVEPDPAAADHLERALRGHGRRVLRAPLDATGIEAASATAVVADALLSTLDDAAAGAVLAEARRILRPGGRVAVHELAPAGGRLEGDARDELAAAGLQPRAVEALRALVEGAGFVIVGSLTGPLALPSPAELMREVGPRAALRASGDIARDAGLRGAAGAARHALERHALALRSALVVAEVPLVLGMLRPRR